MATKTSQAADTSGTPPQSVLVVEDDAILALALTDALEEIGVKTITVCSTTEDALRSLREQRPDAILLDVHLADRDDGWALAELVARIGPKPPRIIFSTAAPQDIPADIAKLGAILEKPYDPADLGALLLAPRKTGLFHKLRGAIAR